MSTDGSMNFSNITTNFNGSNSSFYDILSTIVTDGSSNKIQLISSDPSGVIFGNAFVFGQLLIQFSMKDTSVDAMSSTVEQIVYFPYSYSATPYTMYLTGQNVSYEENSILNSYSSSYFIYTNIYSGSYLNFMAIGPLPETPFQSSINNINNTYDVTGGVVTWNIDSNGTTTMTVTYTTLSSSSLSIYRPWKYIEYTINWWWWWWW